jgi:hypothetical protein
VRIDRIHKITKSLPKIKNIDRIYMINKIKSNTNID